MPAGLAVGPVQQIHLAIKVAKQDLTGPFPMWPEVGFGQHQVTNVRAPRDGGDEVHSDCKTHNC